MKTTYRSSTRSFGPKGFTLIELAAVMSIIVVLAGAAVIAFFSVRQRLQVRASLGRINAVILMARNSSIATRAPSRIVVTNVSTTALGGAEGVRWSGEIVARVSEPIAEWDFEAGGAYPVDRLPAPPPGGSPIDTIVGTLGSLAVPYASVGVDGMLDYGGRRGKALLLDEGRFCDFLRVYGYDPSGFAEATPSPTPTLSIFPASEYALKPQGREAMKEHPLVPAPSPKPAWWDAHHRDEYRYLGRPGLTFDAWIYREGDPSGAADPSARALFVKPQGKADSPDRRVDYLIEIWPEIAPSPPRPDPFVESMGVTDPPNAQLYASFRSMVTTTDSTTMTTDAAYTGRFGIPPNEWHRVTVTWNPTATNRVDRLSLYIDGVKRTKLCAPIHSALGYARATAEPIPAPFISTPPLGHDYEIAYAAGPPGTSVDVEPFRGRIDDLRISRVISESETLPDGLRFALWGTLTEQSFGWNEQGHLVSAAGQVVNEQHIVVINQNRNARVTVNIPRGATEIPASRIAGFNPSEGLLAIGTLSDPYDPRSEFQLRELVRYQGTQKGSAGISDKFTDCEDYPQQGNQVGLDMSHTAPVAVFQAYLVRVGMKGNVRISRNRRA